jgi:hypothetical protein
MKEKKKKKMVLSFNNIMMTQLVQEKPDCVEKKICRSNDQNALKIKFTVVIIKSNIK